MNLFIYDKTFEGLLTTVFEAYYLKIFPDVLLGENETQPLFCDQIITVGTDENKSNRVWKGLQKKLSRDALFMLTTSWLSELPDIDILLFRYIRKAIDAPRSIELNFGDPDVLELSKIGKKVNQERHRLIQFARFQKTADNIFFAPFEPLYNILSCVIDHFRERFADQKWIIYDLKRGYGYYYDLSEVTEIHFEKELPRSYSDLLGDEFIAEDEKLFQQLWREYFKALTIKERRNPKLHKQNMPVRFWKYLTEKH